MSTVWLSVTKSLAIVLIGGGLIGLCVNSINKYWESTVYCEKIISYMKAIICTVVLAPMIIVLIRVAFVLIRNVWGL